MGEDMIAIAPETQSLLDRLLALPPKERIAVAQALWDSLEFNERYSGTDDEKAFLEELMRRDAEMDAGINVMTREEFMAAVRHDRACRSTSTAKPEAK
jgi:putative addiction module component (TIGR02574 family)